MNKAFSNFTWYDKPDLRSPLAAAFLNRINSALNTIDDRVITLDTAKANQSDELLDIKSVTYNSTTGVWTFTHQNGTVDTFDQNIEKIPVSFAMSDTGVISMTTADGTVYTADVGSLIKLYTFVDSSCIDFTVTEDASGNKTITADIIAGSITADKLQPNYLADIIRNAENAASSASSAADSATDAHYDAQLSQSYAIGNTGIRQDEDTDNARYYKEQARAIVGPVTGHIIEDGDGTVYASRNTLRFDGMDIEDDSSDDVTIIKNRIYYFSTIAAMNTAIQNGDVPDKAICMVEEQSTGANPVQISDVEWTQILAILA